MRKIPSLHAQKCTVAKGAKVFRHEWKCPRADCGAKNTTIRKTSTAAKSRIKTYCRHCRSDVMIDLNVELVQADGATG